MGKVVALTGGASGIGAAAVARLVAADCEVHVLDVVTPKAAHAGFVHCDLGRPDAIDVALRKLPQRLDAVVNVAGIAGPNPPLGVVAINFLGMRHLTESLVPRIARGGAVVNVASTAGWDWEKRADLVNGLLDTAELRGRPRLAERTRVRLDCQPVQVLEAMRRRLHVSRGRALRCPTASGSIA